MQSYLALAPYSDRDKSDSLLSKHTTRILMIGMHTEFAQQVKSDLMDEGYYIDSVQDTYDSWSAVQKSCYSLIIFDWFSSTLLALELCYRIRSIRKQVSIMLLMSTDDVGDRVAAFDAGVDDCISKTSEMVEVLARVKARIRVTFDRTSAVLCYGDLILNSQTREVYRGSTFISLTPREFDLLAYLMVHPHQVLNRNQILDNVWGYDFTGSSNVVEVYIRALRIKLEKNHGKRLIHTIRSIGYTLRT